MSKMTDRDEMLAEALDVVDRVNELAPKAAEEIRHLRAQRDQLLAVAVADDKMMEMLWRVVAWDKTAGLDIGLLNEAELLRKKVLAEIKNSK